MPIDNRNEFLSMDLHRGIRAACVDCIHSFTPTVYSADGIPGTEAVVAQRFISLLISNKLRQKYSEMCGFLRARMSLAILRSNTHLL